jgi:uncharacterized protein (DUF4415 family)
MVSYTLDTLPPISDARLEGLKALAALPDNEIDFSDIPEVTEERWKNAVLYHPVKQQITARLDSDVLHWLKSQGRGYQSRINSILREKMIESQKP